MGRREFPRPRPAILIDAGGERNETTEILPQALCNARDLPESSRWGVKGD